MTTTALCLILLLLVKVFSALPRQPTTYFGIIGALLPVNLYLCLNSYFVLKRRANKYDEEDDFCVFLNFTFDWAWSFQCDFFRSLFEFLDQKQRKKTQKKEKTKKKFVS